MADKFIDVPLNNMNNWNRTIELSEFNNKVQDTFLVQDFNNIKNVLECNGSNDIKIDIVHEPILLPLNVKTELYTNEFQSKLEVKEEPIETIEAVNRTEARDYVGNDVIHKEIVYVDWLRSEDIVTSLDINKLDAGILFSYCQTCNEDYKWYCLKCYMLSYILDTSIIDLSKDRSKKTTPKFLTIRNALLGRTAVYALKGIPKNVKFGPFEGLEPIQTTSGCAWKLKEGKLLVSPENIDRSNWMQYINCSVSSSEQNLTIFQHDGNLYFRSSREINAGEELLVYYSEENNSGNGDVQSYCYPVTETVLETVYVCTFCCLGFSSEVYLQKHKAVCPNTEDKDTSKGIVQCAFCKIHLDAKENTDLHMRHCCVKYTWKRTSRQANSQVIVDPRDLFKSEKCHKSNQKDDDWFEKDASQLINENLEKEGLVKGSNQTSFNETDETLTRCESVMKDPCHKNCVNVDGISTGDELELFANESDNIEVDEMRIQPTTNPFQNTYNNVFRRYVNTLIEHTKKSLDYEKQKYRKREMRLIESLTATQENKEGRLESIADKSSSNCPHQNNLKNNFSAYTASPNDSENACNEKKKHKLSQKDDKRSQKDINQIINDKIRRATRTKKELIKDSEQSGDISFEDEIVRDMNQGCEILARRESIIVDPNQNRCTNVARISERSESVKNSIQQNYIGIFQEYVNIKKKIMPSINPFTTTTKKDMVNDLEKNSSDDTAALNNVKNTRDRKWFYCSKCPFKTPLNRTLRQHILKHDNIKPFQCEICGKQFTYNVGLKLHKKTRHVSGNAEKEYKCEQCSYETRVKAYLTNHFRMRHRNDTEIAETYKCSQCDYQTKHKSYLSAHSSVHKKKTFTCVICNRIFSKKDHLISHVKFVHATAGTEKKYKCTKCNFETNYATPLKAHALIHDNIKPHKCKLCDISFRQRTHLRTHMKYKHKKALHT